MDPKDIKARADFLVHERGGPFDQAEQRAISTAAALIGEPKSGRERAIVDLAHRLRIFSSGADSRLSLPTPFDADLLDANTRVTEARSAELLARQKAQALQLKLESFGEVVRTITTNGFDQIFVPRVVPRPGEKARVWNEYAEAQADLRVAEQATMRARSRYHRLAKDREAFLFNPQPAA